MGHIAIYDPYLLMDQPVFYEPKIGNGSYKTN